ncbi:MULTISPECIES: geobacillin-26 family protein [unclassified Rossellomorea]|uniref:geobacillin-26 family protein n=1 Tax=unclassified Rossellomorea TaxID=2837526 RepID=UPI0020C5D7C5|nr:MULTISPECIES: geobacillin-26 family protein [unclassified Rossellomorea]UTE78414.1 geobacillin-26 family protein [Rossellomorea sp. KS-H15a]WGG46378.1 geobacillin-26 family protein [Rossellomorea sp. DA94]
MFKKAMILLFLLLLFPLQINAETSEVIQEGSVGGFHYQMSMEGRTLTWEIGHEKRKKTFQENSENEESLESFRKAVNEASGHRFTMIISAVYVVIVCITTMIVYKKTKHVPRLASILIACMGGLGLFFALMNYMDMRAALQDAGYYYAVLLE